MQLYNYNYFIMQEYIEIFKSLGDETRLRIINLLINSNNALCVCEITDSLEIPLYNISKHLKILKQARLIEEVKDGRWVYWNLLKNNDFTELIFKSVSSIPKSILKKDNIELKKRMKIRTNGKCLIGIQKKNLLNKG